MKKYFFALLILSFFVLPRPILSFENNKFGIHITQTADLNKARELVNSNGGDWGYVTIVIQENDRDREKWQNFFDVSREYHLIPLVRIATKPSGDIWEKPDISILPSWVDFLNSLNWPVKDRFVIIYNEPNHAKEWGNEVNPKEYAKILQQSIQLFKQKNENFKVLNAGFDQAASNSKLTMDEKQFLKEMNFEVPGIFEQLDAWVSHSYPNHGFVGKPWERGRATIKGYEWELQVLSSFGISKKLPVFITETGWPHNKNFKYQISNFKFYRPEIASEYLRQAYENVWLSDKQVVAITPFILDYPFFPFDNFSWFDENNNPYPQFEIIKNMPKKKGEVNQEESWEIIDFSIPSILPVNYYYKGKISLKNTGQSIWGEKGFKLKINPPFGGEKISKLDADAIKINDLVLLEGVKVKPGDKWNFDYTLETSSKSGDFILSWENLPVHKLKIFEAWSLTNKKDTIFNRLFNKILTFWYNLKG